MPAASFLILAALCAFAAPGLEARRWSSIPFAHWWVILGWSVGLWIVLLMAVRAARSPASSLVGETFRILALVLFCAGTFWGYFNARRVGPLDAQWYENMITDYLTQARSGTFPVLVGATQYAFNGAVHPFRSAPWQFILGNAADLLSGRILAPVAIQHLTAIASYAAAVILLYVGLVRSRPSAPGRAFGFALAYAMTPAVTVPFFQFDMYMTLTAQPAMVLTFLAVQRILDEESLASWGWLGVSLAALWYCHPPMALLTSLAAGACLAVLLAVKGFTAKRAAGAVFLGLIWLALASPYFRSMAEVTQAGSGHLSSVGLPALGLGFVLFSGAGYLRSRSAGWLVLAPIGFACLHLYQPTVVPFAVAFVVIAVATSWIRRPSRALTDVTWIVICAVLAGLVAAWVFPGPSLRDGAAAQAVGVAGRNWAHFFRPVTWGTGTKIQPGFLIWFVIVCLGLLGTLSQSFFVQCGACVTLVLVIALGFCGPLSQLFWQNTPAGVTDVIGIAYDLRLLPILAVVVVVTGFYWAVSLPPRSVWGGRGVVWALAVLGAWSLWQHGMILHEVRNFHLDEAQTAVRNRTENVSLERYSWDLLAPPRFIDFGVMDPAVETRFWTGGRVKGSVIGPDEIEEALEAPGQRPIPVVARVISSARIWLELSPAIELQPGQHVLLRFDFLGKVPEGTLVIRGQSIYREYQLPSSGRDYAFGAAPGNSRTLSLWNSGSTTESLALLIVRSGAHATNDPGPNPYCLMYETAFEPERSPIRLESLIPLKVGVTAPAGGFLESFRSYIPGYKAYLDGKPVPVVSSANALVTVWVPPGRHEVWFRFAGTQALHTAVRMAEVEWSVVFLIVLVQVGWLWRAGRQSA